MKFAYPELFLILIPAFVVILFSFMRGRQPRQLIFPFSNRSLEKLHFSGKRLWVLPLLRALALTALVAALARPQTSSSSSHRSTEGIDIMIAFDVSKSMMIEDYQNQSRLDVAKETVREFVKKRSDDRIGFLMFSGEPITLCPPTLDYQVLDSAIEAANTDQLKDGTAIGDALASAVNRIKDSTAKSRIVILLTDGDNNMGSIAPLTAGALAKGYGIKVYSIAFGREGTVSMPILVNVFGQQRKEYQRVNSTINPELLMKISEETNGRFFRATEENSLKKVLNEIDRLERSKIETKTRVRYDEHFQYPLLAGILLLFLELFLTRTRFRVIPN